MGEDGTKFAGRKQRRHERPTYEPRRDAAMAETRNAARVRIAVAQLLFHHDLDIGELYKALGIDPAEADRDALAHLAGVLDGMEAAASGIRDHGLEGWSKPR